MAATNPAGITVPPNTYLREPQRKLALAYVIKRTKEQGEAVTAAVELAEALGLADLLVGA